MRTKRVTDDGGSDTSPVGDAANTIGSYTLYYVSPFGPISFTYAKNSNPEIAQESCKIAVTRRETAGKSTQETVSNHSDFINPPLRYLLSF